ncbi:ubiquinone/menaquinone biosynthesis C-methylase UbiE [Flexilinea flocculi]|uniref:Ubiquinone/menaquinone biosynthesis C-methylase UbiE n=2 Tax=Flexilinea flocculi TaxID=1678840 RepID=A0A0S7BSI5_9CHLR|nr:ubiquinone/menaquinone biosynthesis C-methylase UbiE [Flexilinea flocculi]
MLLHSLPQNMIESLKPMESNKKQKNSPTKTKRKDFLRIQIRELPYFRGLLRAVEAKFYQDIPIERPVLDLGCGDGHFASRTFDFPIDAGIDPWVGPLKEASQSGAYLQTFRCIGSEMPFSDGSFQTVISNSVLEHIPDVDAVIIEAGRVLRPGGTFLFCVPNHQFLGNLSVSAFFDKIHLHFAADWYRRFFNTISRHHHCDSPQIWQERLEKANFEIERYWHYFSPGAFHTLEWGHYFGLPSLICHFLTRKWIWFPYHWNLWLVEKICRKYYDEDANQEFGSYTFYISRKKG